MKVAICGVWHVHTWDYLRAAREENVEIVGVWDKDDKALKSFCEETKLNAFGSFEELLESDAKGVIVCTATNEHKDVMLKIAEAKKSIFTEKVLAFDLDEVAQIEKAVIENGVDFVISLPEKYQSGPQTVKKIVDSGKLGKINYLRFRKSHNGSVANWLPPHFYNKEQCGGGAMIDLGAHGMYLTEWILGMPVSYKSCFTVAGDNAFNVDKVEDNAVTLMQYENGCIAINETSFVSTGTKIVLEVGGEKGFVRSSDNNVVLYTDKEEIVPLEEELLSPIKQFLRGEILDGCSIVEARHLSELMVGAYQNA